MVNFRFSLKADAFAPNRHSAKLFYFYENQVVKITKNEPILRVKIDSLFL